MAAPAQTGLIGKMINGFRKYHDRHPILVAYEIIFAVGSLALIYVHSQAPDERLKYVSKYRRAYIVMRPDDPAATMIKRHQIGLDK